MARDLIISKQSSELHASKLKEKCFLQTGSVVDLFFRLLHSNEQRSKHDGDRKIVIWSLLPSIPRLHIP